ncbi:MAG TPA: YitT family protein [Lactobacillaceae bacterium]|jgi:uncharacterized membrane-anchored protein YitT (DUF2179 family)
MFETLRTRMTVHPDLSRASVAVIYGLIVAAALNFFLRPGHIYSSGFTGLAQIISALSGDRLTVPIAMFLVNLPMLILAWVKLSHRFALYSILAIGLGTVISNEIAIQHLVSDPLINAMFGGGLNGLATGLALRNGVATGGLDILGIFAKRKYNLKMGPVSLAFNGFITLAAGVMNGWPYAFYSIIGIIVSATVLSMVYTSQQQMQVMIVIDDAAVLAGAIKERLHRGVTVVDQAHGAYTGRPKQVIFTIITQQEQFDLHQVIREVAPGAFASIWKIERTSGNFTEKQL